MSGKNGFFDELKSFDKNGFFDLGHPLLNRIAESFVKAAGVIKWFSSSFLIMKFYDCSQLGLVSLKLNNFFIFGFNHKSNVSIFPVIKYKTFFMIKCCYD